ncbi:uncharacterized protein [Glycine max]|uniref:uncharacterized protein n=1 Tax=Glycine max TaxID=3847 RepID=UPI001B357992|nr:uncharacterized protein LOC112998559 [Glycine max]
MEIINLGVVKERKEVKVGTSMSAHIWDELVALLQDYQDIFAWSYQDMPYLSPNIVQHRLPLNPGCSSVKQRLRRMKPEMSLKIKKEVKKEFDAGFLAMARYPEWVANIVLVPKKDRKVYVDDMMAKSKTEEEHLVNLWKLFKMLCKYRLRLNPAKCTFRVKSGNLLGLIISHKWIEVDPNKVKAILEMPKPRTEKQV